MDLAHRLRRESPSDDLVHLNEILEWDVAVGDQLGGLLLSDVANLFVGAYCVKMRGGTYRFQAQYLRKIRVPAPDAIDAPTASALAQAFKDRDRAAATDAAAALYG